MEWRLSSNRVVSHVDGHRIELKSGTWREPFDVHPVIKKGTPAMEVVRLIREGMTFAERMSKRRVGEEA